MDTKPNLLGGLKNMLVELDHFLRYRGKNRKCLSCHHLETRWEPTLLLCFCMIQFRFVYLQFAYCICLKGHVIPKEKKTHVPIPWYKLVNTGGLHKKPQRNDSYKWQYSPGPYTRNIYIYVHILIQPNDHFLKMTSFFLLTCNPQEFKGWPLPEWLKKNQPISCSWLVNLLPSLKYSTPQK